MTSPGGRGLSAGRLCGLARHRGRVAGEGVYSGGTQASSCRVTTAQASVRGWETPAKHPHHPCGQSSMVPNRLDANCTATLGGRCCTHSRHFRTLRPET